MPKSLRKPVHLLLPTIIIVGGFVAACFLWMRNEQRQYALNVQLKLALMGDEATEALRLVNAGADPNSSFSSITFDPPPKPTLAYIREE